MKLMLLCSLPYSKHNDKHRSHTLFRHFYNKINFIQGKSKDIHWMKIYIYELPLSIKLKAKHWSMKKGKRKKKWRKLTNILKLELFSVILIFPSSLGVQQNFITKTSEKQVSEKPVHCKQHYNYMLCNITLSPVSLLLTHYWREMY